MVECTALEMRRRCKPTVGSNPTLSAIKTYKPEFIISAAHPSDQDRYLPRWLGRIQRNAAGRIERQRVVYATHLIKTTQPLDPLRQVDRLCGGKG